MTIELQAAAVELQQSEAKRAELLPDDVEINHLIKQLDMGEPDYSDYSVFGHYFDAQDRHNKAMSMIRHRLFAIPQLRAHIAALEEQIDCMTKHQAGADEKLCQLEAENKRLVGLLKDLVEIDRRDRTCDPDIVATDSHREETWSRAKAALAQTGEK